MFYSHGPAGMSAAGETHLDLFEIYVVLSTNASELALLAGLGAKF